MVLKPACFASAIRPLNAYAFPGANQEGIAVDGEGFLYVAQDSGGIIKLKWHREK